MQETQQLGKYTTGYSNGQNGDLEINMPVWPHGRTEGSKEIHKGGSFDKWLEMRKKKMPFSTINLLQHWKSEKVVVSGLPARENGIFKQYLVSVV